MFGRPFVFIGSLLNHVFVLKSNLALRTIRRRIRLIIVKQNDRDRMAVSLPT